MYFFSLIKGLISQQVHLSCPSKLYLQGIIYKYYSRTDSSREIRDLNILSVSFLICKMELMVC